MKYRKFSTATFAALAVLLTAHHINGREPMQFDDIWKMGLASNSSIMIQKAKIDAARVGAIASFFSGLPRPELEIEFPTLLAGDPAVGSIEVRQALSLSGIFGIDTLIAFDQLGIEEAIVQKYRGELYTDLRRAYASVIITGKEIGVARENVELFRQLAARMQMHYQTGKISRSDVLASAIELRRAQQEHIGAVSREKIARSELNMLIGVSLERTLDLDETITETERLPELDRLTNIALHRHPSIRQHALTHGAAEKSFWKELLQILPAPFAGIRRTGTETAVIFGATLPLWDFNAKSIAQSAGDRTAAEISLAHARRQALFDVHRAYLNASSARQNLETVRNGMTEAQELITAASIRYNENRIDLYHYLSYIKTANEARLRFYQGIFDYDVTLAELERALHTSLRTKEYL
ncbi:MAG: TolC family protein [Spirochaetota bacterium]|mgnify:CR=1 FL=1